MKKKTPPVDGPVTVLCAKCGKTPIIFNPGIEVQTAPVCTGCTTSATPVITEAELLGREALAPRGAERNRARREIAGNVMARLLGSRAACEEMKQRMAERSARITFATEAARTAIEFADALLEELDARERRL